MAFIPEYAPLVVLAFLLTGLVVGALAASVLVAGATRQPRVAGWLLAALVLVGGTYASLLLGFSLLSREKTLAPGEWKYFCEIDCHLAYSVVSVTTAKTLGPAATPTTARGTFYVLTLKTWFDERTIAPWRPRDLPLTPGGRQLALLDEQGRVFGLSGEGQRALAPLPEAATPLTQPLKPGESYTTTLIFDLPDDARQPRLLFTTVGPPTYFLIGHENSFFHKKIYFQLTPPPSPG